MINLIKETLNKLLLNNLEISIKINQKHPICILLAAINWMQLITIIKNARKLNGKKNSGPSPHYRILGGALVVRALKSCTLREAMDLIQHHALYRLLCNLENSRWTPNFRTIHDFEISLGEEGLKRVNEYILRIAHANGFLNPEGLCADTTAQESSIPYPTEIGLSHQFIKSMKAAVNTIGGQIGKLKKYSEDKLKNATSYLKRYRFFASKEEKQKILKEIISEAKEVAMMLENAIAKASEKTISALKGKKKKAFNGIKSLLKTFSKLSPQMDYYVETGRVAKDKIISLFQELARSIPRGKDGKDIEFGIKWCIGQISGGYIFGFSNGNAYEGDYAVNAIKEEKRIFGETPKSFGYDRGGWSEGHIEQIKKLDVKDIGIAPKGKSPWLVSKKKQKKIFSERSQVEGKIGTLKGYGFNKPKAKTSKGMLRSGQLSIIRFNLGKIIRDIINKIDEGGTNQITAMG